MGNSRSSINQLLKQAVELGASDLHLTSGSAPRIRRCGQLTPLDRPELKDNDCRQLIFSLMDQSQKDRFAEELATDFGFGVEGVSRFRANVFLQRGCVSAVFRVIPSRISSLEELGLPSVLLELTRKRRGLVLITGPSGSGKSTTLASMIDSINIQRKGHIITLEDPIEFLHTHKNCLVSQREVNTDVRSFSQALRTILREDPDVVLIGEMRDFETVGAALRIAETGHLTLATLHTNSAQSTIGRIVDVFPPHQQEQVRRQLSMVLEGVICQRLLPELNSCRLVAATEVLIPSVGVRNLIRDKKDHQIYSLIQTGQDKFGMQTMNQSLFRLLEEEVIGYDAAVAESPNPSELMEMMHFKGMSGSRRDACIRI